MTRQRLSLPAGSLTQAGASLALTIGLLAPAAAPAVDLAYLQGGALVRPSAEGFPDDIEAGVGWALPWQWADGRLRSQLQAGLGYTENDGHAAWRVLVAPVLRYQPEAGGAFAEFGLGVAYLSNTRWAARHDLSSHLQFDSRLGAGYRFGQQEVSLNLTHFSNGGTTKPNRGAEVVSLRFARDF